MRLPSSSVAALVLSGLAACVAPGSDDAASSEQASTASDLATAKHVVDLFAGSNGKCKECHGITAATLKSWGQAMKDVDAACFVPELGAQQRVSCLRSDPTDPASGFSAHRLGLYATGASQQAIKDVFQAAFPAATWQSEYAKFAQKTSMPRGGGAPLGDADFAQLKAWVLAGMPQVDQAFGAPVAPAGVCTPKTTPELQAHIAAMKSGGWGARLAEAATPMLGCASGAHGIDCLGTFPDATATFATTSVPQKLRQLRAQKLQSQYWIRSSADGRYVGFGLEADSIIVDLSKPATAKPIAVSAPYDPYFLPSNDGFAFASAGSDGAIRLCKQSLLEDVAGAANPKVTMDEAKCAAVGDSVYMSIGSALDGNRFFMTFGSHENDDGGNSETTPLPAAFGATASTLFTPMVSNGQSFEAQASVKVPLPNEGDMMLSPSSLLAATRFGDGHTAKGYRIHLVKASTTSPVSVDLPLAGEICLNGQKPGFSFDERFVVTHQYVDRADPTETTLAAGSSNILMVDLLTGKQYRVTTTKKGQFALYPHFRADGWLYFLVRDMVAKKEYVIASDAALRVGN